MSTDLEERLERQLRALTDQLDVPATDPGPDLRRGRRRRHRVRLGAVAGTAATVAAASGASIGIGGQLAADDAPAPERTTQTPLDVAPAGPGLPEVEVRDVRPGALTEALTAGSALAVVDDRTERLLAMAARIDTEIGDRSWSQLGIGEVDSFDAAGGADCPASWTCEDVDVEGASKAAIATRGSDVQAIAAFGGQVLTIVLAKDDFPARLPYGG